MVKPGGRVASLEFLLPPSRFWRFWWWLYTRLLLPAGGLLTGGREWYEVGRFLGPSISGHYRRYPVAWTVEAWRRAGFADVGGPGHEPGRRPGDVGNPRRWLTGWQPQARDARPRPATARPEGRLA